MVLGLRTIACFVFKVKFSTGAFIFTFCICHFYIRYSSFYLGVFGRLVTIRGRGQTAPPCLGVATPRAARASKCACRHVPQEWSIQRPLPSPPLPLTRLKSVPCQAAVSHSELCSLLCAKANTPLYPPVGTCGK